MGSKLRLPYLRVKGLDSVWRGLPSGLGQSDAALYLLLGAELENRVGQRGEYWVLDLGTYFGHSAFTFVYGAAGAAKASRIRILSIDLFEQPDWLQATPALGEFRRRYGSTDEGAIGRCLKEAAERAGLSAASIDLMRKDVLDLEPRDLTRLAPEGFRLVAIDCGKTPALMNKIAGLLADRAVAPLGTLVVFQDFFDWHAPWNMYAFWRLLRAGNLKVRYGGAMIPPACEVVSHRPPGALCDLSLAGNAPVSWLTRFASVEAEEECLTEVSQVFGSLGYEALRRRVECLRVGAFLRAGLLNEAESLLANLDATWPIVVDDADLHNAYCRLMHLKTGRKDLSLRLETRHSRRRKRWTARVVCKFASRARIFGSLHVKRDGEADEWQALATEGRSRPE